MIARLTGAAKRLRHDHFPQISAAQNTFSVVQPLSGSGLRTFLVAVVPSKHSDQAWSAGNVGSISKRRNAVDGLFKSQP
jgi:hypothetical protein